MDVAEVVRLAPRLFHVTDTRAWPLIGQRGLLSASALLDLFGVTGEAREMVEARKRPRDVPLGDPVRGMAVLRDNAPVNETVLRRTLDGMTEADWYRHLNSRVYFWADRARLERLARNPRYRGREQLVLHVDTKELLARYGAGVELSVYNTGAVHAGSKILRGRQVSAPVAGFELPAGKRLAELTVPCAVPDIAEFIIEIEPISPPPMPNPSPVQ